jgi:phage-related protein
MRKAPRLVAIFYRTKSGNEPVREWLKDLSKDERRAIGEDIAYVQFKWPIGKPRVDHLRGEVWEVRTTIGNRIARTLFAVDDGVMILLHGYIKKTQQTPDSELALAAKRFKDYINGKA